MKGAPVFAVAEGYSMTDASLANDHRGGTEVCHQSAQIRAFSRAKLLAA
jgi:hypothetical protein